MPMTKPVTMPRPATTTGAGTGKATLSHAATTLYRLVGERVRSRRVSLGMTQEWLAKAVGTGRTSITNLEKGTQHVPLHVLLAVAGELGVELDELLPMRAELGATGDARVALAVGDGEVRMVSPKTATAISQLVGRLPARW